MNVLSLFDGMSCGQIALKKIGIHVENYYASEIDKHAISITQKNNPETIQLGDVKQVNRNQIKPIDLLIGGSPCQGFSYAGKKLNFEDPRSKLFFEYVRILDEVNPKYFLLENVKMKKEHQDIITSYLGVEPIEINSSLVSAQNRKRLYWSNIPHISQPEDKGILLSSIIHEHLNEGLIENYISTPIQQRENHTSNMRISLNPYILGFQHALQICESEVESGKIGYLGEDEQGNRVYLVHGEKIHLAPPSTLGSIEEPKVSFGCLTPSRLNKRQNGQRFNTGDKFYTLTTQDKHGLFIDGYIRKITPIECERLQTVPDNYTAGVNEAQRYKMLGNGWTVDVIKHIFSGLN